MTNRALEMARKVSLMLSISKPPFREEAELKITKNRQMTHPSKWEALSGKDGGTKET